jgi:type VI secretion system protein ImpK
MTLYDICSKLFLYLVTFNRRARRGDQMDLLTVRHELDAIFVEQGIQAQQNPALLPGYQMVEYALAVTADELIINSRWRHSRDWEDGENLLEYRRFQTRVAGVEFFERLKKIRDSQTEVLEIYYACLAVGFRGQFRGDNTGYARERQTLYLRLNNRLLPSDRVLFPKAYEHTITRDFTKPATLQLLRLLIVALVFIVAYFIAGQVAWDQAVKEIVRLAEELWTLTGGAK